MRDYPIEVTNALNDARIEPVNTSWAAQCSDVRLAEWAADIVRAFVDEWWRIGRAIQASSIASSGCSGQIGFTRPLGGVVQRYPFRLA